MSEANVESQENAKTTENGKNDSMEELKMGDDIDGSEQNTSNEDILGANSLMFTDSENDSPVKKSKTAKLSEINDITKVSEELNVVREAIAKDAIVETNNGTEEGETSLLNQLESNSSNDIPKTKTKISALIDSDSDLDERDIDSRIVENKSFKMLSSDSDEETNQTEVTSPAKQKHKCKKKTNRIISDDEQEDSSDIRNKVSPKKSKFSSLVDTDSEQSDANSDEGEQSEMTPHTTAPNENALEAKSKKLKPIRASAKKALDEMHAIQSEQQRLHREAHIRVPYHQPKKYTLQEFLSRRSINKITELTSPTLNNTQHNYKNLKMTPEELEAYAKLMEEREKEAAEFFKSESESESEEIAHSEETVPDKSTADKDKDEVLDMEPTVLNVQGPDNEYADGNEKQDTEMISENTIEASTSLEAKNLQEFDAIEQTTYAEEPHTSHSKCKPIITEVVDLPRLDLVALNISPTAKPMASINPKQNIKRLIIEKSSKASPTLKGDPNMIIDLETGDMYAKKPTGVDILLQRLIKSRESPKLKMTETVNIVSTENGKVEISKVNIQLNDENKLDEEHKPGEAYLKLKQGLKSLITKKRLEDLQKKKNTEMNSNEECDLENDGSDIEYEPEDKPNEENFMNYDEEENVEEVIDEEEEADVENVQGESDEEMEVAAKQDVEEEKPDENDMTDSQENSSDESSSEDCDESDIESKNGADNKRKSRIVAAFQDDSNDSDDGEKASLSVDDIDFLNTPKLSIRNGTTPTATQMQLCPISLYDEEKQRTVSDEENELLNLCSGKFSETQKPTTKSPTTLISQIPITQNAESKETATTLELLGLCSGAFETQDDRPAEASTMVAVVHGKKIVSSDSDEDNKMSDDVATTPRKDNQRKKKFSKKMKKKKVKLGFSDDEESEDEMNVQSENDAEIDINDEENVPETFIDYDSEENEIVVEMTKKDRVICAQNFVEKEAELSESDWGSADEDEKNLDKYDIEIGDEDEFDSEKLRTELEQIHARKMLDKDIREVREIQEMLFEDEENDGVGRERQFKWKNIENDLSSDLNNDLNANADTADNDVDGDEENEHLWRKVRYEREQLLLKKGVKGDLMQSIFTSSASVNVQTTGAGAVRKLNIITTRKSTVDAKKGSPFLIPNAPSALVQKNVRGSFLVRDKETLKKLASLTKGEGENAISIKPIKSKNFLFATLTEEEHEKQKRKADDLLSSSTETGINYMKKQRLEPRRAKCLIDQLL